MGNIKTCATLVTATFVLAFASAQAADPVESFYRGKTITLVISAGPGGGYASYAIPTMQHMVKHIPGNPDFVRQHRQGAGGLVAAKYIYTVAPKDGSVIAMVHRGAVSTEPLFRAKKLDYNPANFGWIGSIDSTTSTCAVWHTAPVKKFSELFEKPLIVGGTGPGSSMDIMAKLLNNLFGTKIKLVTGYPGGSAVSLAMERGEVQGRCGWSWSAILTNHASWVEQKKLRVLVQFALKRSKQLPDVPLITDFAKTQEQKDIISLVLAPQQMAFPLLAPPGMPRERLLALRRAFDATMKDPAYLADMKKHHLDPDPISGAEIEELIGKIYAQPPSLVAKAKEALERKDRTQITEKKVKSAK